MTKAIREIIFVLLVCLAVMLILVVALYRYLPNRKVVPAIEKYSATEEVQDLLEDDVMSRSETEQEPELKYNVTSSDLNKYQVSEDYVPGKLHPFAEYTENTTVEQPQVNSGTDQGGDNKNTATTGQDIPTQEPSVYTGGSGTK